MARYRGPRLKVVRRLGELPGLTTKIPNRNYLPGQHGPTASAQKPSQYRIRLQEKQKLRYNYGVTERKLLHYVKKARQAKGPTGETLLQFLEMRLDTIVFRLGLAPSIQAARQIISHGHVHVNGGRLNIPSYQCLAGDTIKVSADHIVKNYPAHTNELPTHLSISKSNFTGTVERQVTRSQIALNVDELLIIEFYSRR